MFAYIHTYRMRRDHEMHHPSASLSKQSSRQNVGCLFLPILCGVALAVHCYYSRSFLNQENIGQALVGHDQSPTHVSLIVLDAVSKPFFVCRPLYAWTRYRPTEVCGRNSFGGASVDLAGPPGLVWARCAILYFRLCSTHISQTNN